MNCYDPHGLIDIIRDNAIEAEGDGQEIVQALMHAAMAIVVSDGDCPICALRDAADMLEEHQERSVH